MQALSYRRLKNVSEKIQILAVENAHHTDDRIHAVLFPQKEPECGNACIGG